MDFVVGFLTHEGNLPLQKVDAHSRRVGLYYKAHPERIREFKGESLTGNAKLIVGMILSTGIAYNYNLEMSETNNNGGSLGLLRALPTASGTVGFSSKLNLQRQNTRIFSVTDTFGKLVTETDPRYCTDRFIANPNIVYPLTGNIGMLPVIREFVNLALFSNLSGSAVKNFTTPDGPSQMAEQLEFTTTIDVSATPKIIFSPASKVNLHIAEFSLSAQAVRKDLHKLTVGLYIPNGAIAARDVIIRNLTGVGPMGTLATANFTNEAEAGALAVVNQALLLKLFRPQIVVQP